MFPKPSPQLLPNTYAYKSLPLVKSTGFREYDARWLLEQEINLMGAEALGIGLARLWKSSASNARSSSATTSAAIRRRSSSP